ASAAGSAKPPRELSAMPNLMPATLPRGHRRPPDRPVHRAPGADEDPDAAPERRVGPLVAQEPVSRLARHLEHRGLRQVHVRGGDHREVAPTEHAGQPQPPRSDIPVTTTSAP